MDDRLYPKDDDEERIRQADARMKESSGQPQESIKGFDPRREVSADAHYIVKHLWIIFVLLPVVLGVLLMLLK